MNPLSPLRDTEQPLEDLVERANELLAAIPAPADGRVAASVDARAVRYYQTLGVLDRPLRYAGRRAVYGYRHLLQLLCAKALQARGHSLAQVQQALAGASLAALEAGAADALGAAPPPPAPAARGLVAAELAPGVTVILDPARIPEPEAVLARLARALTPHKEQP